MVKSLFFKGLEVFRVCVCMSVSLPSDLKAALLDDKVQFQKQTQVL